MRIHIQKVSEYIRILSLFVLLLSVSCKAKNEERKRFLHNKHYKVWNAFKVGVNVHNHPKWCYVFYKNNSFEKRYYNNEGESYIDYGDHNVGYANSFTWRMLNDSMVIANTQVSDYKETWFIKKLTNDTLTLVERDGAIIKLVASKEKKQIL